MNEQEKKAIETLRALDGKIIKHFPFPGGYVAAFSEKQARVLYKKKIMRKEETDVGIVIFKYF